MNQNHIDLSFTEKFVREYECGPSLKHFNLE